MQDEDSDHGATPLMKVGEKRFICRGDGAVGERWEGLQGRWSETHFLVEGPDSGDIVVGNAMCR